MNNAIKYAAFFQAATGKPEPYDYQRRLAESPSESRLINIPPVSARPLQSCWRGCGIASSAKTLHGLAVSSFPAAVTGSSMKMTSSKLTC